MAERRLAEILRTDFADIVIELIVSSKAAYDMWSGAVGEWAAQVF